MEDDKLEVVLNAALSATEEELEKSEELSVGYDMSLNQWTLIIRYNGDSSRIEEVSQSFKKLYGGYGIVKISKENIESLSALPEVLYIEKPKRLYFEERSYAGINLLPTGIEDICISSLRNEDGGLYGEGVLVAVIDSSVDFFHPVFMDVEGRTRIIEIYDQNTGFHLSEEEINEALFDIEVSTELQMKINAVRDISGHGTAVAGICAGNFASDKSYNIGIATKSKILAVKLGRGDDNFPRTTELMEAVDYVVHKSIELSLPVAVNISFGNAYGSHDGTSLIETFIDAVAAQGKVAMAVGSGNEGAAGGHFEGFVAEGQTENVELFVGVYESSVDIQLWKSYSDIFEIEIIGPSGTATGIVRENDGDIRIRRFTIDETDVMVYLGQPGPYSIYQEIYFDLIPVNEYITEGIWQINITGSKIVDGRFDMWLPVSGSLNGITSFGRPSPEVTLTIPSTASKVITVGAYDSFTNAYADFSGRGYTRMTRQIKPDIVAPGVNIVTAKAGGGLAARTGTSMSTPFVTGAAALLMEWGIVRGNDPYLYGEKIKAYLIRGATKLPGINEYPDTKVAWGRLCVADSLPRNM